MNKVYSVLFITHDCSKTGAPIVLEMVIDSFIKNNPTTKVYVACIDEPHVKNYDRWNKKYNCFLIKVINSKHNVNFDYYNALNKVLNLDVVYGNTILTLPYLTMLKKVNPEIKTVLHLHENAKSIEYYESNVGKLICAYKYIDKFISVSQWQTKMLLDSGVYDKNIFYTPECINTDVFDPLLNTPKLPRSKTRIIGIGTACVRKGLDRFIQVSRSFDPKKYEFVWIGSKPDYYKGFLRIEGYGLYEDMYAEESNVIFLGETNDISHELLSADIFLMLSREDPCPLVMLESLYFGLGTVTIKSSGDSHLFATHHDVVLSEYNSDDVVQSIYTLETKLKDLYVKYFKTNHHKHLKRHISNEVVCKSIIDEIASMFIDSDLNQKITYVFVDDMYPEKCLKIIDTYVKHGITNIKLLTSKNIKSPYVVKINPITSKTEYSEFVLKKLVNYVHTEFCLISQWDGFIVNFDKWNPEFLNYDYIGAPWFWKTTKTLGGNGGFSFRSKRMMEFIKNISYDPKYAEDEFICEVHGQYLVDHGFRFPPEELAKTFSIEGGNYDGSYGFHNFTTSNVPNLKDVCGTKFHHSGDLGDIIYSLPFVRYKGGGTLILSSDYKEMSVRCPMTWETCMQLNELLVGQSYITDVQCALEKPEDIDIDLNGFRKTFIEWGLGKFTKEEENNVRQIPLTQLYRINIDTETPVDIDQEKWIHLDSKIQFDSKPIVVNRTARYHRTGFPWKKLVNDYGDKMMFVGTKAEFDVFVEEFGYIKYYPTQRIIQLAQILNGAKLFIGNQSFPYSLVEAMKIPAIQETNSHLVPNCMFRRNNAYLTFTDESLNYSKIQNFINQYI